MSSGYIVSVDPSELNRYLQQPEDAISLEDMDESQLLDPDMLDMQDMYDLLSKAHGLDTVVSLLDKIPAMEADIIELYFLKDKRQADIAVIFGMTQAAVSYRLGRGILRIKFLLELPDITIEQMTKDLAEAFPCDTKTPYEEGAEETELSVDVKILVHIWQTTCQTKVARMLNLTQGRVRHKFFGAVRRLKFMAAKDERWKPYADMFGKISLKKFNILSEVKLPQWSGRGGNQLL